MSDKVEYWVEGAEYDLDTARAMLETGRHLYVGFMCHQVIEKMLKACFVNATGQIPPYTHNLELLARKSSLDKLMNGEQQDFLRRLEPLNVESRYPADRELLAKALTPEKCRTILTGTEEMFEWIRQRLSE